VSAIDERSAVLAAARAGLPHGKLVVALSGGADSAVAAWAAVEVAGRGSVRLVHVDHGLADSPFMEEAARRIAAWMELPLRVVPVDVGSGSSLEGRARIARLAALEQVAASDEWIVTGHQQDDVAETVLGNLVRGAGSGGLAGIAPRRDRYVRPMLDLPRATVRGAAVALGVPFADDPANEDRRHRRNVLRHGVLPMIERCLERDVRGAIARSAGILARDDALLEALALAVPLAGGPGTVKVPVALLLTLDRPVATRVARRALKMLHPPYGGSFDDVGRVLEVAADGVTRQLGAGCHAVREGPMVTLVSSLEMSGSPTRQLPIPGSVDVAAGTIRARVAEPRPRLRPLGRERALLDFDAAGPRLVVRSHQPGERVALAAGSKTVVDALAEAGVPARLRPGWPVVAGHENIAWVPGARIAAWAAVIPTTRRLLELRWEETVC
jgi:tRNA(Ile)-lysidine synthase